MVYLVIRLILISSCIAAGIRVAQVLPPRKISIKMLPGSAIMATVIGYGTFQSLTKEYRKFPEKKRQAPFWTASFDEAPIAWFMTGATCAAAAAIAIFTYVAIKGGDPGFALLATGLAAGFYGGIAMFKRKSPPNS